jgi:hypothetical protein
MHVTSPREKREAMLQVQKLEEFFNWLLDCRFFPESCGTPRRFLPDIDREIGRLKKLDEKGCPAIKSTIENLEVARSHVANTGYEFQSEFIHGTSTRDENTEPFWRLFAATCVACALWPDSSPNRRIWEKMKSNGYVSSQNIGCERTLETRVRRFGDSIAPGFRRMVLQYEYQNFKSFSAWPDTAKALQAGWRLKDVQRLSRLTAVGKREVRMLEKLCANYEARKGGLKLSVGS